MKNNSAYKKYWIATIGFFASFVLLGVIATFLPSEWAGIVLLGVFLPFAVYIKYMDGIRCPQCKELIWRKKQGLLTWSIIPSRKCTHCGFDIS